MGVFRPQRAASADYAIYGLTLVKLGHGDIEKLFGRK
jgi:hypothetical protein